MNKLIFEELVKDLSNQTIFVLLLGGEPDYISVQQISFRADFQTFKLTDDQIWSRRGLTVCDFPLSVIDQEKLSFYFFREGNRAGEVSLKLLVHFIHQLSKIFSLLNVTDHIKICHDSKKFALQMMENDV